MNDQPSTSESSGASPNGGGPGAAPRPPVNPPPAYPPPPGYAPFAYPPRQGSALGRAVVGVLVSVFIVSLLVNVYLAGLLVSMTSGLTETQYQAGDSKQRIVILPVRGLIDDTTAGFVREALKKLREDEPMAVILRVDSGGGYVSPSDRIWHELVRFKQETGIPVVASFAGMAASGGYYIAAPADAIIAEPTCITGSIGVMSQAFTVDQLLTKVGVTPEVQVASESPEKATANDITRPWTEKDRAKLRALLDHLHGQFVDVVRQGRSHLTEPEVAAVADGRIFTADDALSAKLIDEVGYLDKAIEVAAQRAGLAAGIEPRVTVIDRPRTLLGALMQSRHRPTPAATLDGQTLRQWASEWSVPQLMYLWQGR